MTKEIKRILNEFNSHIEYDESMCCLSIKEVKALLDYITNLQQDLDKANNIIEKDRQFYKCRMDEYAELKKENKKLKECYCNRTDCSGRLKDSKKYDSLLQKYEKLQQENERLKEDNLLIKSANKLVSDSLHNCKSRCEKVIEYIKKLQENDDIEIWRENGYWAYILNILNGSDKE